MAATGERRGRAEVEVPGRWLTALSLAALVLSACSELGPPPMEPLTAATLESAERRWQAHAADSYHVVVRVRAPRFGASVYDVVVDRGELVRVARDGAEVRPEEASRHDYSVAGLFGLLRRDLPLADVRSIGDVPPVDLRARFEAGTGRPVRYRRTVGAARRRVLLVEILRYEPLPPARASSSG